jgi:hypothetical protein
VQKWQVQHTHPAARGIYSVTPTNNKFELKNAAWDERSLSLAHTQARPARAHNNTRLARARSNSILFISRLNNSGVNYSACEIWPLCDDALPLFSLDNFVEIA